MEASVTILGRVTLRQKEMSSTFQAKENGKKIVTKYSEISTLDSQYKPSINSLPLNKVHSVLFVKYGDAYLSSQIQAKVTGQLALGILLSLCPEHWDYRPKLPLLAFTWVVGV